MDFTLASCFSLFLQSFFKVTIPLSDFFTSSFLRSNRVFACNENWVSSDGLSLFSLLVEPFESILETYNICIAINLSWLSFGSMMRQIVGRGPIRHSSGILSHFLFFARFGSHSWTWPMRSQIWHGNLLLNHQSLLLETLNFVLCSLSLLHQLTLFRIDKCPILLS